MKLHACAVVALSLGLAAAPLAPAQQTNEQVRKDAANQAKVNEGVDKTIAKDKGDFTGNERHAAKEQAKADRKEHHALKSGSVKSAARAQDKADGIAAPQ